jgi:hypothetical protein
MGLATFWAIFSQTHLVTLLSFPIERRVSMERQNIFGCYPKSFSPFGSNRND